jgi:hypothetical protein
MTRDDGGGSSTALVAPAMTQRPGLLPLLNRGGVFLARP